VLVTSLIIQAVKPDNSAPLPFVPTIKNSSTFVPRKVYSKKENNANSTGPAPKPVELGSFVLALSKAILHVNEFVIPVPIKVLARTVLHVEKYSVKVVAFIFGGLDFV
jgi:hypothetical protein